MGRTMTNCRWHKDTNNGYVRTEDNPTLLANWAPPAKVSLANAAKKKKAEAEDDE